MKTIDLSSRAFDVDELLRLASEGNLIVRAADGREFLLAEVDDIDQEIALINRNPDLLEFLKERSKPSKTFTRDQLRETLGLN